MALTQKIIDERFDFGKVVETIKKNKDKVKNFEGDFRLELLNQLRRIADALEEANKR